MTREEDLNRAGALRVLRCCRECEPPVLGEATYDCRKCGIEATIYAIQHGTKCNECLVLIVHAAQRFPPVEKKVKR